MIKTGRLTENGIQQYKIVILGPAGVGKSAITLQYTKNQFISDYLPTIEDEYTQRIQIDGQLSEVSILDTAGEEDYVACRSNWINGKEGFILAFSIDREDCKKELDSLHKAIKMIHHNKDMPIVLVANKIDLPEQKRLISSETVAKWANEYGIPYFEVSARLNKGISDIFVYLVREIRKRRELNKKMTPVKRKKSFFDWCNLI